MRVMFLVVIERSREALVRRHLRLPTEHLVDLAKRPVVIADVDGLAITRKWNQLVISATVDANEQSGELPQADVLAVTQIKNLAF